MSKNLLTKGVGLMGQVEIRDGAIPQYIRIPVSTASSAEVDTGFDLSQDALVVDAFVRVKTAAAATVLDVGLLSSSSGGDADGFADGLDVSSTGLVGPGFTVTTSVGGGIATNTWGVLLSHFIAASSDFTPGVGTRKHHLSNAVTAKSVSVTADTTVALSADLYLGLVDLRTSD